jgi:hypothetical protein
VKVYGGADIYVDPRSLTFAQVGGEWSASRTGRFVPRERDPGTHWIGGWVDPRAGLDDMEKRKLLTLPELKLRPLRRPARNQLLYRLSYRGSPVSYVANLKLDLRETEYSVVDWIHVAQDRDQC